MIRRLLPWVMLAVLACAALAYQTTTFTTVQSVPVILPPSEGSGGPPAPTVQVERHIRCAADADYYVTESGEIMVATPQVTISAAEPAAKYCNAERAKRRNMTLLLFLGATAAVALFARVSRRRTEPDPERPAATPGTA